MAPNPHRQEEKAFIETCVSLSLLNDTDAQILNKSINDGEKHVSQAALQQGLLTQADIDIVQSIQRPNDVVPGYRILDLIGRGAMGVVYRAEQLDLEKIVALKTILISNVHDPTIAARFEREAKALARLQHPNIVQALNFGKHEGRYYFAMEYVPGLTCEQALRGVGMMPASRTWPIVRQVASGLMHALRQNLIHRDIKPANLLLLPPPEGSSEATEAVKIADFGLAMFADQGPEQLKLTTGGKIMGSPTYMSLEQFSDQDVDFRSDMYSLGATAWHLLFGTPPFQGASIGSLYQQKSVPLSIDHTTLPVAISSNELQLLLGLLDPDPNRRPHCYEQLIDSIDALDVDSSPPSTSASPQSIEKLEADSKRQSSNSLTNLHFAETQVLDSNPDASADAGMESTGSAFSSVRVITCAIVIVILGLVLSALSLLILSETPRGERSHTLVVGNTPLFDGVTLSGWDVGGSMVGAWNTVEAPDSSTAIACTTAQGALTRRFPDTTNPRISLFVWLQPNGGTVSIDFALDPSELSDVRASLQISDSVTTLGQKESDFGDLDVAIQVDALPTIHDRYHVVHIERQPTDWFVFLEQKLIGSLPIDQVGDGNAIRLVVDGGETDASAKSNAFFADVQLYDLQSDSAEE